MKKSTIVFTSVNFLCMLWFLGFVGSSRSLAVIEERNSYDFGDSAGFLLMVAPVLFLCLVANIVWASLGLLTAFRRHGYQAAAGSGVVLSLWVVVALVTGEIASLQ